MKPDVEIYQSICNALQETPGRLFGDQHDQIAKVGDSLKCDQDGPQGSGDAGISLGVLRPVEYRKMPGLRSRTSSSFCPYPRWMSFRSARTPVAAIPVITDALLCGY